MLFLRDEQLMLLIGSPAGARKVTAIVQAFLNMIYFDMSVAEAIAASRIHVENSLVAGGRWPRLSWGRR